MNQLFGWKSLSFVVVSFSFPSTIISSSGSFFVGKSLSSREKISVSPTDSTSALEPARVMATKAREELVQRAHKKFHEQIEYKGCDPVLGDWPESVETRSASKGIYSVLYKHYESVNTVEGAFYEVSYDRT